MVLLTKKKEETQEEKMIREAAEESESPEVVSPVRVTDIGPRIEAILAELRKHMNFAGIDAVHKVIGLYNERLIASEGQARAETLYMAERAIEALERVTQDQAIMPKRVEPRVAVPVRMEVEELAVPIPPPLPEFRASESIEEAINRKRREREAGLGRR